MFYKFIDIDGRFAFSPFKQEGWGEISKENHAMLFADLSNGKLIVRDFNGAPITETPLPTEADKIKAAESAVQAMLDAEAAKMGYDNIQSASQYAALPVGEPFQAEGAAFLLWRAKCWRKCYEILTAVKSGQSEPTPAELIAAMPALLLP